MRHTLGRLNIIQRLEALETECLNFSQQIDEGVEIGPERTANVIEILKSCGVLDSGFVLPDNFMIIV